MYWHSHWELWEFVIKRHQRSDLHVKHVYVCAFPTERRLPDCGQMSSAGSPVPRRQRHRHDRRGMFLGQRYVYLTKLSISFPDLPRSSLECPFLPWVLAIFKKKQGGGGKPNSTVIHYGPVKQTLQPHAGSLHTNEDQVGGGLLFRFSLTSPVWPPAPGCQAADSEHHSNKVSKLQARCFPSHLLHDFSSRLSRQAHIIIFNLSEAQLFTQPAPLYFPPRLSSCS